MKCEWIVCEEYSSFKGKNILIAGGTGFIGKRATSIFRSLGLNVYIVSRKKQNHIEGVFYELGDLNSLNCLVDLFPGISFDYAVYMAANIPLRGEKKETYFDAKQSTFDPFINFCEAFLSRVKRFVYISSIDVYGGCSSYEYNEQAEIKVATPYGLAKYIGELYTRDLCETMRIPFSILRFSQVYGPNEPLVRIIPLIRHSMVEKTPFTLFTDGTEKRRFLFVDDAIKAIVHGLLYANSGVYNISGPEIITMQNLVKLIETTWNMSVNLTIKGVVRGEDNVPSYDKAQKEICFNPDISMAEGMLIIKEEEECHS